MENIYSFVISDERVTAFLQQGPFHRAEHFIGLVRKDSTFPFIIPIPQEIRNATFYLYTGKAIRSFREIVDNTDAIIVKHTISIFIKPLAAGKPP